MDFRELATREAAALVSRFFAVRSEMPQRDWQALRQALDSAVRAAEAAFASDISGDESRIVAHLVERLDAAAGEQVEAAVSRVTAEAQAAADVLQQQVAEQVDHNTRLDASLKESIAHGESLARDLEAARNESAAVGADLARAREGQAQTEAALRSSEAAWQKDIRAKEAAERELHTLREALDVLRTNYAGMSKQLDTEVAQAQAANDNLRRELDEQAGHAAELKASARQARAEADALAMDLKTERNTSEAIRAELTRVREAQARAESTLRSSETAWQKDVRAKEAAEREVQSQRSALDQLRAEFTRVSKQLDNAVTERMTLATTLRTNNEQMDAADTERQALADKLAEAAARVEAAEKAHDETKRAHQELQDRLQSAATSQSALQQRSEEVEGELQRWRDESERSTQSARQAALDLERVRAEAEAFKDQEANRLRDQVVTAVSQPLDGLLVAYRRFAASRTIADVPHGARRRFRERLRPGRIVYREAGPPRGSAAGRVRSRQRRHRPRHPVEQ